MQRYAVGLVVFTTLLCVAGRHVEANLLANAGFEIGVSSHFDSWTQSGDAQVEPWAARSGTNGLAFYGWTTGGMAYQDAEAIGGSNYTFTVWGFRDSNFSVTSLWCDLRLEFYADAGATLKLAAFTNRIGYAPVAWTLYGLSAPAPTSAVLVRAVLIFGGTPTGGAFKWDDAELVINTNLDSTHYVSTTGSHVFPYTSWATAARDIQAGVAAGLGGDTVLVAAGTYPLDSQIVVAKPLTVRGTDGAAATIVDAQQRDRCFYVGAAATINGFTITNGYPHSDTNSNSGGGVYLCSGATLANCAVIGNRLSGCGEARGGGVYGTDNALITNCLVAGNSAVGGVVSVYGRMGAGGGVYVDNGAVVANCVITGNLARGSSAMIGNLPGLGGGVYCTNATIRSSLISGNRSAAAGSTSGSSYTRGGGALLLGGGTMLNCLVIGNRTDAGPGGPYTTTAAGGGVSAHESWTGLVVNCTLADNSVVATSTATSASGGGFDGGAYGQVHNSIIYFNTRVTNGGSLADNWSSSDGVVTFTCTTPGRSGTGNLAVEPSFMDRDNGNYRLAAGSPCIDAGSATGAPAFDLDGTPRPLDGNNDGTAAFDMGAYEAAAGMAAPNLLINGTFETPSAWTFIDNARLEGWAARNGTNGLALYGWTDGGLVWQDIAAAGTSNYTFSVWGFRDADFPAGLAVELKIEFLSDTFTPLVVTQRFLGGSASWAAYSISGISPPDTKIVRVVIAFSGTPGAGGAFKCDDAVLLSSEALFNVRYVAAGAGHIYPYTNWAGAATNLQAAIDAASANETILVSNGVYMGETVVNKSLSIRGLGSVCLVGKLVYPLTDSQRALRILSNVCADVRNVTIRNGYHVRGAGICNEGTLVLKDSAVVSNAVNGESPQTMGGGLYNAGNATIERCTISFNMAQGQYPGGGSGFGAGVYCASGSTLVITDCLIARNEARGSCNYNGRTGESGFGGGIYNDQGAVTLVSSTLASNTAAGAQCGYNGGNGLGGAIYTKGPATLCSCTLAYNRAAMGSGFMGGPYAGEGGAIYLENGAPVVNVDNTLIARNTADTVGPDCRGTLNASGRNLLGSIADCAIIGDTGGVIIGADPRLTGLGMNGGPTLTCAPLYGSPVIDQGSSNSVPSFDQRGMVRPVDGNMDGQSRFDIGACEYNPQVVDSDGDSLADYDEVMIHHSSPTNTDTDADGMGDGAEARAGTNLTDPADLLDMRPGESASWNGAGIVVRWSSVGGRQYSLLRATNLVNGFSLLESGMAATPPINTVTDTTAAAAGPYYYRIRLE